MRHLRKLYWPIRLITYKVNHKLLFGFYKNKFRKFLLDVEYNYILILMEV